ncbi:MAG: WbuC family cupin fold metalloprotein [Leptolyngbyaceae cyanobacterium CSU_1_3]|nr:WbuC family cupin fold metalloprotein [Leptolyngbyaceae cyanobacterium CSU_1_3]
MDSAPIKLLTQDLFDTIAQKASQNSRLRQNYNFHELSDKVQRFLNVLQPGTYVRPHRHTWATEVNGFEFFLVLQGSLGMILMNEQGEVTHTEKLSATGATRGMELTEGTYHTLVCLAPDTVILELKEGPYNPQSDKGFLPMFPGEGTPESRQLIQTWELYFSDR